MSPSAFAALRDMFRVSELFACRGMELHRSTQRHATKGVDIEEAKLRRRLREIGADHIRYGRRMAYRLLSRDVCLVNHKRVYPPLAPGWVAALDFPQVEAGLAC